MKRVAKEHRGTAHGHRQQGGEAKGGLAELGGDGQRRGERRGASVNVKKIIK